MAYGQRPRFFRAEHSAMTEGENCAYGPTMNGKIRTFDFFAHLFLLLSNVNVSFHSSIVLYRISIMYHVDTTYILKSYIPKLLHTV